jgi:asparagine synthase (glutamine-hydrolysing)
MLHSAYVERVVDLLDPAGNILLNMTVDEALGRVASCDVSQVRQIDGQFALLHRDGKTVRMVRSIGRPMRYFLAKRAEGPCLVVAERIDEIYRFLQSEGLEGQFHPSYTRMVPAHFVLELKLLGCPDPNPVYRRYFSPERNRLSTNLDEIGAAYFGALAAEISKWIDQVPATEPIGVLFSGGIDSGAVFLVTEHLLRSKGHNPARLKAFTLTVEGQGDDVAQAQLFLKQVGMPQYLEPISVPANWVDYRAAIEAIEDYKPLDVQSAAMALALCKGIRRDYPEWRYLLDGDGGDENLKDYPIEDNPELTIRSVLNNTMLYQEGWGVDAVKHSLTYSGGQSRGHVRSSAPARSLGFAGLSPFALPNVIEVAEGIPFIELTDWQHEKLYALKGEITARGVRAITGVTMPINEKRRFQHGAAAAPLYSQLFPKEEVVYRRAFNEMYAKN